MPHRDIPALIERARRMDMHTAMAHPVAAAALIVLLANELEAEHAKVMRRARRALGVPEAP